VVDPLAVAGLLIAGISLLVSGGVAYMAEFRGPHMNMDLLRPPANWMVNAGRPAASAIPGTWHQAADLQGPFTLIVGGECPGRVWNNGPKGGAVWDLALDIAPIRPPWSTGGSLGISDPFTLAGKNNEGIHVQFTLYCHRDELPAGFQALVHSNEPIRLSLKYSTFGPFGRTKRAHSEVFVAPREVADRIAVWAADALYRLDDPSSSTLTTRIPAPDDEPRGT
jgi:hypothetical protein